ncbi:SCO family protein [uncultured Paraglaciecola sp.]|uniref:SCO family protein n=1 Tax=uncultured Paraglaciecola sp. TaxID=1765024 RepID=UPI0025927E75|nr:SCO family protein [uncultured Paraglaciecola sp.]
MDLKKRIAVLGWKMKLSHLVTINLKQIIIFSGLVLGAVNLHAAESLPYYDSQEFSPRWLEADSPELEDFHRIPAFSFTDQDGNTVTEQTFKNKVYVAGFFFSTCPGICPKIRSKLAKVQETYLDTSNVKILQHSIRPTSDTIDLLKDYADEHGIKSGHWYLVTGEKESIYSLAKSAYFASEDLGNIQNTNDFLHTESILLIDKNRHIRGIYNGLNSASMNYLISDINTLLSQ